MSGGRDRLADIEARLGGWERTQGRANRRAAGPHDLDRASRRLPPGLALLPLRLFLGVTFVYAGVQKLSDPGFLHPGAPTYIGSQLHQFAHGAPGGFILRTFAFPDPALAGVGVALVEIAVGLLTVSGLLTRPAAFVGLCLNLLLFLTNSWHTYPYFLGSDIVFVFAWLPLVLTGASGQPAVDHALAEAVERRRARRGKRPLGGPGAADADALTRRALVARGLGATALLTGFIAAIATLTKGSYRGGAPARTLGSQAGGARGAAHGANGAGAGSANGSGAGSANSSGAGSLPAGAKDLGPASRLPPGQAAYYPDPATGAPDILVRAPGGALWAHSAICTHAGCTVQYSAGQLIFPLPSSIFDATTGAVLQGPAVTPLPARRVIERGGQLYAVRS